MRTLIIAGIVILCFITIISCGSNNEKTAIFTGRVTASDTSLYLADVHVFEQSHNHLKTVTDSLGYFRLDGVAFEEHNIYFEKEGFEPFILNFEYTGDLTQPIITKSIVLLKPGEEIGEVKPEQSVSGDSLSNK